MLLGHIQPLWLGMLLASGHYGPSSLCRLMAWKLSNSLFTIAVLVVCIGLAELVCRLMLPQPGFHTSKPSRLFVQHPTRDHAYASNFRGRMVKQDFDVTMRTNALGLRDELIDLENQKERRILAMGNSYTVGWGVEREETWPTQLEFLIKEKSQVEGNIRVINGGVSGYGLHQIRMFTEELIPILQPELIVLGLFTEAYDRLDDPYILFHGAVVRSSETRRMQPVAGGFLRSRFWQPWAVDIDLWLAQHFYFGAHLSNAFQTIRETRLFHGRSASAIAAEPDQLGLMEAKRQLSGLLSELEKLHEVSVDSGVPLVVMLVTKQLPNGSFSEEDKVRNQIVIDFCEARQISAIDVLPALIKFSSDESVFRFKTDGHWTPSAHKMAALMLMQHLQPVFDFDKSFELSIVDRYAPTLE